jgi:hypothetical protein
VASRGGAPAKPAKALVSLAGQPEPPLRWAAGADAVEALEHNAKTILARVGAYRELSSHLDYGDASVG